MTKLYDCLAADLLNNGGKYNPEARAVSYAILQEKRRIMDQAQQTRTMAMIDTVPETILDVLAVELRTPAYSEDFPIETKRTLIKGTLTFYKRLGTPAAVNWVIQAIFGNGSIEEWFDYGGEPHHFRVSVSNDGTFTSMDSLGDFLRLVSSVKRLSSWLDAITVETDLGTAAVHIGGLMATVTRLAIPELPDVFSFESTTRLGVLMAAAYRHPLPEVPDTFSFQHSLHTGGRMATSQRIPIPAVENDITLTHTGRIGVRGAVNITVPLPELS